MGRGNELVIERMEVERGGHWRYVEHAPDGTHGFEGRYREIAPPERLVQTFEWDGAPGHVSVTTACLEGLGNARTRIVTTSLFHTKKERDDMLDSGMTQGLDLSYAELDRLLVNLNASKDLRDPRPGPHWRSGHPRGEADVQIERGPGVPGSAGRLPFGHRCLADQFLSTVELLRPCQDRRHITRNDYLLGIPLDAVRTRA